MNSKVNLFTIGFTKKNARTFFNLLKQYKIRTLIDIRLNNVSQLAGFTKKDDLKYFIEEICEASYIHRIDLSPTDDILKDYKKGNISWDDYEMKFKTLLQKRKPEININLLNNACLLCSEATPDKCHRRLVAEYFKKQFPEIEIKHI